MSVHARVALFFYVMLGLTLKNTWGLFHLIGLMVLSLSFAMFCWFALRNKVGGAGDRFPASAPTLSALLAFNAFILWFGSHDPAKYPAGLMFPDDGPWLDLLRAEYGPLALFLAAAVLLWFITVVWKRVPPWLFYLCIALALAISSWQRLAILKVSPNPIIDTIVVNNGACDYLLKGKNPYAADATYEDIYRGGYDYPPAFPYWPAYLYWSVPFRVFCNDTRYGTWAADLVTALLLWATARRLGLDFKVAALMPLVWMSFPVTLFVLEQAWIDPVLIMTTAALVWALVARNWNAVGIALGLVCGVKQYGTLVAAFTVLYLIRYERQHLVRPLVCMAIVLAVLFVPFLILDAPSFYDRTIKVYSDPTLRHDALSWPAAGRALWLSDYVEQKGLQDRLTALQPPTWFFPAFYLTIIAGGVWRILCSKQADLKVWSAVLPFSLGTIFLFGKIAFCNYYYFVAFLVLVYLLLSLGPTARNNEAESDLATHHP